MQYLRSKDSSSSGSFYCYFFASIFDFVEIALGVGRRGTNSCSQKRDREYN